MTGVSEGVPRLREAGAAGGGVAVGLLARGRKGPLRLGVVLDVLAFALGADEAAGRLAVGEPAGSFDAGAFGAGALPAPAGGMNLLGRDGKCACARDGGGTGAGRGRDGRASVNCLSLFLHFSLENMVRTKAEVVCRRRWPCACEKAGVLARMITGTNLGGKPHSTSLEMAPHRRQCSMQPFARRNTAYKTFILR